MLQIIGKGGMAKELSAYIGSQYMMAEFEEIDNFYSSYTSTIIAVGEPRIRKFLSEKYKFNYITLNYGKIYGSIISPTGVIICPGAIITTNVLIGNHCIINVNASIHHDVMIGDFVTVGPSATICGNVKIGNECYIGANSVIRENINICNNVTIGAGSVVVKDIIEPGVYVGVPCHKIK